VNSALIITVTAVLGVLLTVAGSLGVWLAMRTGQNTQTVRNFRDAAQSWREKAEAMAADLVTVQGELTQLRIEYDQLKQEHNVLRDVVSGKSTLDALSVQMDQVKNEITLEIRLSTESVQNLIEGMSSHDHSRPARPRSPAPLADGAE
jgi:gas vesicle protein